MPPPGIWMRILPSLLAESLAPPMSMLASPRSLSTFMCGLPGVALSGSVAGAGHVAHLVQVVACQKMDPDWRESYAAVSRVLRGTVRASSAVEGRNSVLRRHQSRHRTVSQGLLDLKRLYGNCREFRQGKPRQRRPEELLGLKLPSYRFWDLLGMPPRPEGGA